ncbi:rhodanese homology domain pair protein [Geotalea daltonii FRC-32]|uniref:Rhodanese homology domain pair protein n=1 Tax=Geotalea daltonii (strain DSM 22248 / JCM 15807 / FRC-32) TaxID=316067 RepID=B9M4H0_GEODF|nr:selenite/tellurite reduction operon rhodanese-like protein ExtH [Geotalea daltonii]ACM19696.1 rhodanese homology domain pair protein [Geotalea daltonii FRC-32]
MSEKVMNKSRLMLVSLLSVFAIAALAIWGCGTSGYENPSTDAVTTKTATALIQASDLKQWIDAGLVNKAGGYDRVVVLEVSTETNYNGAHIAGAQYVNLTNDLMENRYEGPMLAGQMVLSGTKMDALIQKLGIDANTTIVFTSSEAEVGSPWNLTRGYATFRYWGFPKNRLKVLDGGNKAWKAAGYAMTTAIPTITKSTYVATPNNINRVRTDLRASLPEMIAAATAGTATNDFIDGRATSPTVPGPTTDLIDGTKYVVFEGLIKGGRAYSYNNLLDATTKQFKSIADIRTGLNIPATAKSVYALCRAGNIASALFFAIDGYAYYNEVETGALKAVWYDGSWGQWGLMSSSTANGGKLVAGSVWDTSALTDSLTYNVGRTLPVSGTPTLLTTTHIINYGSRLNNPEPSLADGNQLEAADAAYHSPVTTSTGGGAAGGSGGGC